MGNSTPQTNARSLRESLVGLDRFAQHTAAYEWAVANGRVIDMFGNFAKERHLLLFQSGNEFENWIDPVLNVVYKMNTLVHVGGDIPNARFATEEEIAEYMCVRGFEPMIEEGYFENEQYILSDIKPKNVLRSADDTIFVIDAEIRKK